MVKGTAYRAGALRRVEFRGRRRHHGELRFKCFKPRDQVAPFGLALGEMASLLKGVLGAPTGFRRNGGPIARRRCGGGCVGGEPGDPLRVGLGVGGFRRLRGLRCACHHPGKLPPRAGHPLIRDLGMVDEPLLGVLEPVDSEQSLEQPFPGIMVGLQEIGEATLWQHDHLEELFGGHTQ